MGPAIGSERTDRERTWGATMGETGLANAIARIEGRFGVHALARGETSERHRSEIVIATKTSLDHLIGGGLVAGEPLAFVGPPSVGKRSPAAFLVVAAKRGRRVAVPAFVFERLAWERRFDRTVGWSFSVEGTRGQSPLDRRALFCLTDGALVDLGTRADLAEVAV